MTEPEIIFSEGFTLAGISWEANLQETEDKNLVHMTYQALLPFKEELGGGNAVFYLLQQYPGKPDFSPFEDAFHQTIALRVSATTEPSEGIQIYQVPAGRYVTYRYEGADSGLAEVYDFLYRQWLPSKGLEPLCFDFEYWGGAYEPENKLAAYELFIPIA